MNSRFVNAAVLGFIVHVVLEYTVTVGSLRTLHDRLIKMQQDHRANLLMPSLFSMKSHPRQLKH